MSSFRELHFDNEDKVIKLVLIMIVISCHRFLNNFFGFRFSSASNYHLSLSKHFSSSIAESLNCIYTDD